MAENKEDLDELLKSFLNKDEAAQAKRDIRLGDELLGSFTSSEPDGGVVDEIKSRISRRLVARKKFSVSIRRIAAAAVIIILATAGIKFIFNDDSGAGEVIKAAQMEIWNGEQELAALTSEVEQVETEIRNIRLDEYGEDNGDTFAELELEMIEINGDFWKG